MSMKDAYIDKMSAQLHQAEADIERLKAKAEMAEADARLTYQRHVAEMQRHYAKTHSMLSDVKAAGEHAWGNIKFGVDAAWTDLRNSVEDATKRF